MPREREYETAAERQAAYRARKRAELEQLYLPVVDVNEPEPELGPPSLPSGFPTLGECVAEARRGAELHFALTSPNATMSTKELAGTLARAETYARWRYRGVLDGSVNGL